jgi:hypothetical protein
MNGRRKPFNLPEGFWQNPHGHNTYSLNLTKYVKLR